jgi:excisionase family DNA binding protein
MTLTVPEAAQRLRCSEWAVRRAIKAKENSLRASFIAGKWLIDEDDLEDYKAANENRAPHRRRRRRAS